MAIDIKKIEALLDDGKYEEVKNIIRVEAVKEFTGEEKGAALAGLAEIYIDIQNSINKKYLEKLKKAISDIQEVDRTERQVNDEVELEEVKRKLNM